MGAACTGLDEWLRIQGPLPQHPSDPTHQSAMMPARKDQSLADLKYFNQSRR